MILPIISQWTLPVIIPKFPPFYNHMSLCFKLFNLIIVEQEPPVRVNTFTIVAMTRSDLIASKGLSQSIGITPSCLPSLRNKSGNQKNQPVRLSKVPYQELGRLVSHTQSGPSSIQHMLPPFLPFPFPTGRRWKRLNHISLTTEFNQKIGLPARFLRHTHTSQSYTGSWDMSISLPFRTWDFLVRFGGGGWKTWMGLKPKRQLWLWLWFG